MKKLFLFFLLTIEMANAQNTTLYSEASTSTTLLNSSINCVAADPKKGIWIGTQMGLAYFDGSKWENYLTGNHPYFPTNPVSAIAIDPMGNKWIANRDGVYKFDGINWQLFSFTYTPTINDMAFDKQGRIWCATYSGVFVLEDFNWVNYTTSSALYSLPTNNIRSVTIDKKGTKWFATDQGVVQYNDTIWKSYPAPAYYWSDEGPINNNMSCSTLDKAGNLWFGGYGGISTFNGSNWTSFAYNSYNVSDLFLDDSGAIWCANSMDGLSIYDKGTWTNTRYKDGVDSFDMNAIAQDVNGTKWFGAYNGLSNFDGTNWTNYHSNGLLSNIVPTIIVDENDNKLFATRSGLCSYNDTTWSRLDYSRSIEMRNLAQDNQGNLFTTDSYHIYKWDGLTWISPFYLGSKYYGASALAFDAQNVLWLGASNGVLRVEGDNQTPFSTSNGLINNTINCITPDVDGSVWIGTSAGISKFDGKNWVSYPGGQGLVNGDVRTIAIDQKGNKWIGTNNGVSKFDGVKWTTYFQGDGLSNNDVNHIVIDMDTTIWFATLNGLCKLKGSTWTKCNAPIGGPFKIAIDHKGNKWLSDGMKGVLKWEDGGAPAFNQRRIITDLPNDIQNTQAEVFPMPSKTETTFMFPLSSTYTISILDLQGKPIAHWEEKEGNRITLSLTGIDSGMYFYLALDIKGNPYTGKILINK